eukprot:2401821-Rhodomonas_salina.2
MRNPQTLKHQPLRTRRAPCRQTWSPCCCTPSTLPVSTRHPPFSSSSALSPPASTPHRSVLGPRRAFGTTMSASPVLRVCVVGQLSRREGERERGSRARKSEEERGREGMREEEEDEREEEEGKRERQRKRERKWNREPGRQ